jgi:carbonic anhydrase
VRSSVGVFYGRAFADCDYSMDQSVREDLNVLKTSPFVRKELADAARGFVYDLKTGLVREVQV